MATYLEIQNQIADEVYDAASAADTGEQTQIQRAIKNVIKHYERMPFYFNRRVGVTFSLVAGQEYYDDTTALSSGDTLSAIIEFQSMKLTIAGGTKDDVLPRDFNEIDQAQDGAVTGDPEFYAFHAQQLRFYPIPDAVRTITMAYTYKLAVLSADGDTNAWTTDAEEMIRQRAEWYLWLNVRKVALSADRAQACKAIETDALAELLAETRRRISGSVTMRPAAMPIIPGGFNIYTNR